MAVASAPSPMLVADVATLTPPANYDAAIWRRAHEYVRAHNLNFTSFANEVDYSRSVVSLYMRGRYQQPEEIETVLRAYFSRLDRTAATGTRYAQTYVTAMIIEACRDAFEDRSLLVIYGPPQMGKTTGVKRFVEMERGRRAHIFMTANMAVTERSLVVRLAKELRVTHCGSTDEIGEEVVKALRRHPHVLIVDDAALLKLKSLERLRYTWEQAGCGLVLVGTTELMRRLFPGGGRLAEDLAQFTSRVDRQVAVPTALPVDQLAAIARAHAPWLTAKDIERIAKKGRKPRALVKIIGRLARLRELNPQEAMADLIEAAEKQIFEAL